MRIDLEELRTTFRLTKAELASALGISARLLDDDGGDLPAEAEAGVRKLLEVRHSLERYIGINLGDWLASPNHAFHGRTPRDLIASGQAGTLLAEFRRMRRGEPL